MIVQHSRHTPAPWTDDDDRAKAASALSFALDRRWNTALLEAHAIRNEALRRETVDAVERMEEAS